MPKEIPITESGKRILDTVKDELFPLLEDMKNILVDVHACRISYQIYSCELNQINDRYLEKSTKIFQVIQKLQTPDILFQGLENTDQNAVDYFQYKMTFEKNIGEAFVYTEIIDRTLDRKFQSIQNTRTIWISMLALVLSALAMNF
jgi:hypothetical protein